MREKSLPSEPRQLAFTGKRRRQETRYFYHQARALADLALEKKNQLKRDVVAVLFHDSDDKATSMSANWLDKKQNVEKGFEDEGFDNGVPMIPKPTSEAWLICALKKNPYQGCDSLENRSGSRQATKPLKAELELLLQKLPRSTSVSERLSDAVRRKDVNFEKIQMPSFKEFRKRLEKVIE